MFERQTWKKTPALGKLQSKLGGYIEHNIITVKRSAILRVCKSASHASYASHASFVSTTVLITVLFSFATRANYCGPVST